MTLFSEKNTTAGSDNYTSTIDVMLKRHSLNYELYVYDPIFTRRYSPHFIDLEEKLGKEFIDTLSYDAFQISSCENKWPIFLKYKVLYSNIIYLNKYHKEIPKTWDELIETGEYILKKEREENNNKELIGYNGLFPYETFQSDENFNVLQLMNGNILFSSYWDAIPTPTYKISPLPGKNKGVSGSCLGGFNIGISKYVPDENIEAAIEVLKFFMSEEIQKDIAIKYGVISPLKKIYDDKELCEIVDCEYVKSLQEWTAKATHNDMKSLAFLMGMDGILFLVYIIFNVTLLKDFFVTNLLNITIILLFSLSNHFYLFIIRILLTDNPAMRTDEEKIVDRLLKYNNPTSYINNSIISSVDMNCPTFKSDNGMESEKVKSTYNSGLSSNTQKNTISPSLNLDISTNGKIF
ncbi:hypothetical protein PIROE2DRAFT_61764 [Piromyces sp. E2]|nr:hypothetical protein PIROE2DRAFT_61764 [Piromyces sp. E2]|eukprot:OUM62610.1 hypothetical protein PIROE2DRAFT_61764 [Piromyces sp. E2]